MDPAALASLCALLAQAGPTQALPPDLHCPSALTSAAVPQTSGAGEGIAAALARPDAREAIARVAYAEAGNQGDSGLAGVVYTILNRLQDGRWGSSVESVVDAPAQFEPVLRAGGTWRRLRPVSEAQRARIETIINLALDGRLPDLTHGARYFQNVQIVAAREAAGTVTKGTTNFGGAAPSAVIGAHSFYAEAGRGRGRKPPAVHAEARRPEPAIFVGENRASADSDEVARAAEGERQEPGSSGEPATVELATDGPRAVDANRGIFVLPDGRASDQAR